VLSTRKNYKRGFCFVRQDATFLLRAGGTSVPRLTLHYRPAQARSHDGMLIQSDVVPALPRNTCLVPDLAEASCFLSGGAENRIVSNAETKTPSRPRMRGWRHTTGWPQLRWVRIRHSPFIVPVYPRVLWGSRRWPGMTSYPNGLFIQQEPSAARTGFPSLPSTTRFQVAYDPTQECDVALRPFGRYTAR